MKPISHLIACAARELTRRERAYPEHIRKGWLEHDKARHELDCMEDIFGILKALQSHPHIVDLLCPQFARNDGPALKAPEQEQQKTLL